MKIKNIKHLDDKIKKYESIETIFENDNHSTLVSISIIDEQEKINDEKIIKNEWFDKNSKK
jgi:hypothetical protein